MSVYSEIVAKNLGEELLSWVLDDPDVSDVERYYDQLVKEVTRDLRTQARNIQSKHKYMRIKDIIEVLANMQYEETECLGEMQCVLSLGFGREW